MDVHHHPDLHHKQKEWKEYFLEFVMIFLAVFLGFIAENIRETLGDRVKEKEYINSFTEDLEADSGKLSQAIPLMQQCVRGLDTLVNQLYLFNEGKADTRIMYYTYHHYCSTVFNIELSQRTISQLKSSANMRLIHDARAAGVIADFEVGFDVLNQRTEFYKLRQEDAAIFGLKIFDFNQYQKANTNQDGGINLDDQGFLAINYQPPLNCSDKMYLKDFAAHVGYFRNAFAIYINYLNAALPGIRKNIQYLKKAYQLK